MAAGRGYSGRGNGRRLVITSKSKPKVVSFLLCTWLLCCRCYHISLFPIPALPPKRPPKDLSSYRTHTPVTSPPSPSLSMSRHLFKVRNNLLTPLNNQLTPRHSPRHAVFSSLRTSFILFNTCPKIAAASLVHTPSVFALTYRDPAVSTALSIAAMSESDNSRTDERRTQSVAVGGCE